MLNKKVNTRTYALRQENALSQIKDKKDIYTTQELTLQSIATNALEYINKGKDHQDKLNRFMKLKDIQPVVGPLAQNYIQGWDILKTALGYNDKYSFSRYFYSKRTADILIRRLSKLSNGIELHESELFPGKFEHKDQIYHAVCKSHFGNFFKYQNQEPSKTPSELFKVSATFEQSDRQILEEFINAENMLAQNLGSNGTGEERGVLNENNYSQRIAALKQQAQHGKVLATFLGSSTEIVLTRGGFVVLRGGDGEYRDTSGQPIANLNTYDGYLKFQAYIKASQVYNSDIMIKVKKTACVLKSGGDYIELDLPDKEEFSKFKQFADYLKVTLPDDMDEFMKNMDAIYKFDLLQRSALKGVNVVSCNIIEFCSCWKEIQDNYNEPSAGLITPNLRRYIKFIQAKNLSLLSSQTKFKENITDDQLELTIGLYNQKFSITKAEKKALSQLKEYCAQIVDTQCAKLGAAKLEELRKKAESTYYYALPAEEKKPYLISRIQGLDISDEQEKEKFVDKLVGIPDIVNINDEMLRERYESFKLLQVGIEEQTKHVDKILKSSPGTRRRVPPLNLDQIKQGIESGSLDHTNRNTLERLSPEAVDKMAECIYWKLSPRLVQETYLSQRVKEEMVYLSPEVQTGLTEGSKQNTIKEIAGLYDKNYIPDDGEVRACIERYYIENVTKELQEKFLESKLKSHFGEDFSLSNYGVPEFTEEELKLVCLMISVYTNLNKNYDGNSNFRNIILDKYGLMLAIQNYYRPNENLSHKAVEIKEDEIKEYLKGRKLELTEQIKNELANLNGGTFDLGTIFSRVGYRYNPEAINKADNLVILPIHPIINYLISSYTREDEHNKVSGDIISYIDHNKGTFGGIITLFRDYMKNPDLINQYLKALWEYKETLHLNCGNDKDRNAIFLDYTPTINLARANSVLVYN